ncbi:MAG TPA: hypothetical protein VFY31_10480 [Macromonas sp.]|nr:hypothetical protein [Macromonas sp.]
MNRLQRELLRLYGTDGTAPPQRALVLEVRQPADWAATSAIWQGVQGALGLPPPAIAVNGKDGYQLWFSLSETLAPADGHAFLVGLQQLYLAATATDRCTVWPAPGDSTDWPANPQLMKEDHWSAFVTPDLAPIFAADPWLDLPPGEDAQADILQGLRSISTTDFQSALLRLQAQPSSTETPKTNSPPPREGWEPRAFLQSVMNDPDAPLALRIEAAKALLPCER